MTTELNHRIPIDFNNAVEVPDSHTWFHSAINSSSSDESVPLIDLNDPQAVDKIKKACETWGIFQVTNHGVPVALLAQIEHQSRRFFELAPEQKLRALKSPGSFTGYGIPPVSQSCSRLMWSEGFTITGSPLEHARRVWPQDYSAFCTVIEDYQEQMMGLAEKITSLMFKSLGLSGEDVEWFDPNGVRKSTHTTLHLNSYPKCPDPTRAMGMAEHTDSSLITLLYLSSARKGLEVYHPDLSWVNVDPISNAITVLVSDLMQIISNGQFKSALHRVVVSEVHRFSVAYFFGPNTDLKISPPLRLIKDAGFPMYRPISWKELLHIKAMYYNKSLETLRFDSVVENSDSLVNASKVEATTV